MDISIGIDLGTTNTVVSLGHRGKRGEIEVETQKICQIGSDKVTPEWNELLPSVLYVEGEDHYVGNIAKAMKSQTRKNVISNSKNYIGQSKHKWIVENREYTPEVVASYFLKSIKNFLSTKIPDDSNLNSAVITVPASFDIDQKRATKVAARLAGFEESKTILISEPTAAILDFINQQKKYMDESKYLDFSTTKKVLVFDLGGGTCDVAILDITMNENKVNVEEISVSPHTLVGGNNFDAYAVFGIIEEYNKKNKVDLRKILGNEKYKDLEHELSIRCEKAKLFFSGRYDMFKNFPEEELKKKIDSLVMPISIPNILNGTAFKYSLTMAEYNKFINPLLTSSGGSVDNIIDPIIDTLKLAKLSIEEVDYIFCAGGMTMYPAVVETLTQFFKKSPISTLERMMAVSRGAAVFHYYKVNITSKEETKEQDENVKIDIIPTMPQSVFLNIKNGFPITLIKAGTKAGTPIKYDNILKSQSELNVELELYGGRSFFDPKLKKLRNAKLEFPKAVKRGESISLILEYTDTGILNFDAYMTENKDVRIRVCLDDLFTTDEHINKAKKYYNIECVKGIF